MFVLPSLPKCLPIFCFRFLLYEINVLRPFTLPNSSLLCQKQLRLYVLVIREKEEFFKEKMYV